VIYLILKMLAYLLLAMLAGGGAGWLLRHLAAGKQEEDMQRTLADARARVPQFESLIRSRDEQINRLREDLKEKDVRINALVDDVRQAEKALKDKTREANALKQKNHALEVRNAGEIEDGAVIAAEGVGSDSESSKDEAGKLKVEVKRLERELSDARAQVADALEEAASAEAEVVTLKAELERSGSAVADFSSDTPENRALDEVRELELRLKQKAEEFDRLSKVLVSEQRRVVELERERELQNKSLQVLHQQLELERERGQRVAAG
jgi:chromosome segregation ATPase